jgi:hypothetical protein
MVEVNASNQIGFVQSLKQESNLSGAVFDHSHSFPGDVAEAEVSIVEQGLLFF